jgi:transcriptional regulator with XRE-family HTH domain
MADNEIKDRLKQAISAFYGIYGAQTKFAQALSVTNVAVSEWINGKVRIPQAVFEWFAANTDIRVEWILTGAEPMWKPVNLGESRQDIEELARKGHVVYYRGEEVSFEELVDLLDIVRRAEARRKGNNNKEETDDRDAKI